MDASLALGLRSVPLTTLNSRPGCTYCKLRRVQNSSRCSASNFRRLDDTDGDDGSDGTGLVASGRDWV